MAAPMDGMIQRGIFEDLQRKIDEDTAVKDALRDIVQALEKQTRNTNAILARVHSTPSGQLLSMLHHAEASNVEEVRIVGRLNELASRYPFYKYQYAWTRQMQDVCLSILECGYLGGLNQTDSGTLLTIEQVGAHMGIPVNLKDRDAFHLTIEEYLLALVSLIEELARLARNSVTLGDYQRPLQISQFIKDVHAGFQILNLKNDTLRKRVDGIKYRVKDVEDVVYDLSLRGLLSKD